jgi:hypothetical protein
MATAVDRFFERFPDAKEIRDIREHDDEYLTDAGWYPDNATPKLAAGYPAGSVAADATSSIIDPGRYLIGGRLHVEGAMKAAEELFPLIRAAFEQVQAALSCQPPPRPRPKTN